MKLAIISHTEHFRRADGTLVAWGPTAREIDHLARVAEHIEHVAVLHPGEPPPSAIPYTRENVTFTALPPTGGPRVRDKVGVIAAAPQVLRTVRAAVARADAFQFRAPTGIGTYVIPWLARRSGKPGWFKYAGNWGQAQAPFGYRVQRGWLKRLKRHPVTINGRWPSQPPHALSFENPCLDAEERTTGAAAIAAKDYAGPLAACFVGRVEEPKGILAVLDALRDERIAARFASLDVLGDGVDRARAEALADACHVPVRFHGAVPRDAVGRRLADAHVFFLPSTASEGFPKVIAEAWNYGCVPVVSDVSSIAQFVTPERGCVWPLGGTPFVAWLAEQALASDTLRAMASAGHEAAATFTFEHYVTRILQEVLAPQGVIGGDA